MNRLLGRRLPSLNAAIRDDGDSGEWHVQVVDACLGPGDDARREREFDNRRKTLSAALTVLNNRERRSPGRPARREQITLAELARDSALCRSVVRR